MGEGSSGGCLEGPVKDDNWKKRGVGGGEGLWWQISDITFLHGALVAIEEALGPGGNHLISSTSSSDDDYHLHMKLYKEGGVTSYHYDNNANDNDVTKRVKKELLADDDDDDWWRIKIMRVASHHIDVLSWSQINSPSSLWIYSLGWWSPSWSRMRCLRSFPQQLHRGVKHNNCTVDKIQATALPEENWYWSNFHFQAKINHTSSASSSWLLSPDK